jgi:hypothetical protein
MQHNRLPAFAIFFGSFLLFGVQPMLGRTLLPSFGGTAAVWTVCLAAYQTLLVAGYFYAHVVAKRPLRMQRTLHVSLLTLAAVWTAAFAFGHPMLKTFIGNSGQPALEVLFCVLVFAGIPYVLLSAGSTLVQAWLVGEEGLGVGGGGGRNVYRLYAVSNSGSFCGLLAYPFILEPYVSLSLQWWGFAVCLAVYAVLLARVAAGCHLRCGVLHPPPATLPLPSVSLLWFLLPAVSVFLLNAVTAHLTLDVMPLPLLWVVLLGAFLLSYVVGFSGGGARWLGLFEAVALTCVLVAAVSLQRRTGAPGLFVLDLAAGVVFCFAGCTFLHGWLYRIRPASGQLTRYYLFNALGGASGGLLASLVAPVVFKSVAEFPLALVAFVGMAAWLRFAFPKEGISLSRWSYVPVAVVVVALVGYQWLWSGRMGARVVAHDRGFFGTVKVVERPALLGGVSGVVREFVHGTTVHGIQAQIPGRLRMPTAYYTPDAGGVAIMQHPAYKKGEPLRVGILGLGIGVLVAYSRTNDTYRCYEISPEVLRCAEKNFTFLKDSPADVGLVIGDARKALERERDADTERFDVLFVDAFTGDNLPAHLSTKEAFKLYFDRLAPGGILAVNISNWHLDLTPLMKAVADHFHVPVVAIRQEDNMGQLRLSSMWAFFIPNPPPGFQLPPDAAVLDFGKVDRFVLPTDEKGSFVGLVNWPWKRD